MIEVHDDIVYMKHDKGYRHELGTLQEVTKSDGSGMWVFEPHAGVRLTAEGLKAIRRIVRQRDKASQ